MKKNIIIVLIIVAILIIYLFYRDHVSNQAEQREYLISTCNSIEFGSTNITETDRLFEAFHSEDLDGGSTTSKRLYGLSESRFDSFCVLTYTEEGVIIDGGVSYD